NRLRSLHKLAMPRPHFLLCLRPPPRPTLFPYTTLFRSEDLPARQSDSRPFDDAGERAPAVSARGGRHRNYHEDLRGGAARSTAAAAIPSRAGPASWNADYDRRGRRDWPDDEASGGPPADTQLRNRLEALGRALT